MKMKSVYSEWHKICGKKQQNVSPKAVQTLNQTLIQSTHKSNRNESNREEEQTKRAR